MYSLSPIQNANSFVERRARRSLAIPMPTSHIKRTESEIQLYEDKTIAEYRDLCMFNHLIEGIHRRQRSYSLAFTCDEYSPSRNKMNPSECKCWDETDKCIENIILTRNHSFHLSQDQSEDVVTRYNKWGENKNSDTHHTEESIHNTVQKLDDWFISDFNESVHKAGHCTTAQNETIPDMYESDDSSHGDEVFDIDL